MKLAVLRYHIACWGISFEIYPALIQMHVTKYTKAFLGFRSHSYRVTTVWQRSGKYLRSVEVSQPICRATVVNGNTDSIKRKRQLSVRSGCRQQGETRGRLPPGQYLERGFPVLSAGPTPHTPLTSWDFSIVGEVDQPKRLAWGEFRALCKRFPGGDHEPAIATLIAGGDAVRRKLTASPPASLVGQGSSPPAGVRRALPWRLKSPGGKHKRSAHASH
jgi:hypothetical protein